MASILKQMQDSTYDLKYLWDLEFINPKPPEALKVTLHGYSDTLFSLESYNFDTPNGTVSIPYKNNKASAPFQISFYDIIGGVCAEWFKAWVDYIYPEGTTAFYPVKSLYSASGEVKISKLALDNTVLRSKLVYIFPDGDLQELGESEDGLHTYTLSFKIAGSL